MVTDLKKPKQFKNFRIMAIALLLLIGTSDVIGQPADTNANPDLIVSISEDLNGLVFCDCS